MVLSRVLCLSIFLQKNLQFVVRNMSLLLRLRGSSHGLSFPSPHRLHQSAPPAGDNRDVTVTGIQRARGKSKGEEEEQGVANRE